MLLEEEAFSVTVLLEREPELGVRPLVLVPFVPKLSAPSATLPSAI